MNRLFQQELCMEHLSPARATQYLDLMWGHTVLCDMSAAHESYEEDKKALRGFVGKSVRISLSIEEVL